MRQKSNCDVSGLFVILILLVRIINQNTMNSNEQPSTTDFSLLPDKSFGINSKRPDIPKNIRVLSTMAQKMLLLCNVLMESATSDHAMSTTEAMSATEAIDQMDMENRQSFDQATQTESDSDEFMADQTNCSPNLSCSQTENLKEKLKEIVRMNVGWQQLYSQRLKQISELENQLDEMRQVLSSSTASSSGQTQLLQDNELSELKMRTDRLEHENKEMEERSRQLRAEMERAQRTISQQQELINKLSADDVMKRSVINALEAQAVVYREDFEKERQDRQRAHSRLSELEDLLNDIRKAEQKTSSLRRAPSLADVNGPRRFVQYSAAGSRRLSGPSTESCRAASGGYLPPFHHQLTTEEKESHLHMWSSGVDSLSCC